MWLTVKPSQTGCAVAADDLYDSPHLIAAAGDEHSYLHVYLCGTNGQPIHHNTAFHLVHSSVASGHYTIALSYCYGKIADKERNERIQQAYPANELQQQHILESYHQDICVGGNGCSLLLSDIDESNSIIGRLRLLLQYLKLNTFVSTNGTLNYSKIIVSGHSQGSGHACYLAKNFPFKKTVLISGPQELVAQNIQYNWIYGSYQCTNVVSFMHRDEEGTAQLIQRNWERIQSLECTAISDITALIQSSPRYDVIATALSNKKSFVTTIEPTNYENKDGRPCHNSTTTDKRTPQVEGDEYSIVIDNNCLKMTTKALYSDFWRFLWSIDDRVSA